MRLKREQIEAEIRKSDARGVLLALLPGENRIKISKTAALAWLVGCPFEVPIRFERATTGEPLIIADARG